MSDKEIKLHILNIKNKKITAKAISDILKKYDIKHKIKNLELFQEALTPSSYVENSSENSRLTKIIADKNLIPISEDESKKCVPLEKKSYQRLEFLGDSVIHLMIAEYLFNRYQNQDEGFMTRLRTKIENDESLAKFTKMLGLHEYVLLPHHLEVIGGRENNYKIMEDVFEAFIGALYLETSIDICKKLFISLLEKEIDFSNLICVETNYKDTLLQYYHKMKWNDPEYGFMGTEENNNKKIFKMNVKGFNTNKEWVVIGYGIGNSKKKGEQEAARNALIYLKALKKTEDNIVNNDIVELYSVDELEKLYS
jgi:dsRNA-specific ribonuclease